MLHNEVAVALFGLAILMLPTEGEANTVVVTVEVAVQLPVETENSNSMVPPAVDGK